MLPSVLPHVLCGLVNSGRVKTGADADLVDTRGLQNSAYEPRLRNCGSRCCKQYRSHNCYCTAQHPLVFHLKSPFVDLANLRSCCCPVGSTTCCQKFEG